MPDSRGLFCHGGQLMGKITSSQIIKTQLDRRKPEIHQRFSLFILCFAARWRFPRTAARTQGCYLLAALPYLLRGEQRSRSILPSRNWGILAAGKTNQTKGPFENNAIVLQHKVYSDQFSLTFLDDWSR